MSPQDTTRKYYEDFPVGGKFITGPKAVTEEELNIFCILTLHARTIDNTKNIHMNAEFAKQYGYKDRLVPGVQTLSYINGLLVSANIMSRAIFLGVEKARFTAPVYPNDSITVESEVVEKRDVKKYPDRGIIRLKNTVKNQDGVVVCEAETLYMVLKKKK